MFLLVLFYMRKRESKFIFSFAPFERALDLTYPNTQNFYWHHFEGCKYCSFSGMRRSLMGNHIQQSCRILLQQIFLNDVFFVSCLDSQLLFWPPLNHGIYNLNVPKTRPIFFQIFYFQPKLN